MAGETVVGVVVALGVLGGFGGPDGGFGSNLEHLFVFFLKNQIGYMSAQLDGESGNHPPNYNNQSFLFHSRSFEDVLAHTLDLKNRNSIY